MGNQRHFFIQISVATFIFFNKGLLTDSWRATEIYASEGISTNDSPEWRDTECSGVNSSSSMVWYYYNGYCYSIYNKGTFDYGNGKEFCQRNGAYLASFHSSREMLFISNHAPRPLSSFWIGLRKDYSFSLHKWEDLTPVDFLNFYTDDDDFEDDDDDDDDISFNKYCVVHSTETGYWSKRPCDTRAHVICQYRNDSSDTTTMTAISVAPNSPGYCPDGWYTFDEKCYKIFGNFSNKSSYVIWSDARDKCKSESSDLVSIHSKEEQDFLKILMLDIRSDVFIGLHRSSYSREFRWIDSSSLDFTEWNEGEPNNQYTKEECVQMLYFHEYFGKWNDVPCRSKSPFICERPKDRTLTKPGIDPSLCPEPLGWMRMRNSCYKVLHESKGRTSWIQAQSFCRTYGGNLATVISVGETIYFRRHLTQVDGPFWIGVKSTKRHKYTRHGKDPLIYSNWEKDQPKEVSDESNCVAVDKEAKWMVRNCNEEHSFICEVSEDVEAPTIAPYQANMTCPDTSPKWHDFGGDYCYIIEINQRKKWHEAACECTKEGGFLTSFHSMSEISVILHHVKGHDMPLHIGFQRDRRGRFVWADGSPTDFVNWNYGEPNDVKEQCTEMHTDTGKWNDIPCAVPYGYICSTLKVPISEQPASEYKSDALNSGKELGTASVVMIVVCALFLLGILAFVVHQYGPSMKAKFQEKISYSNIKE